MEFLRGENLDALIKNGQQGDLRRILRTALQIARAMAYVHSQDIVHRDLKPQNLHVDQNGRVKLVDFGIAKSVEWNKTQAGLVKGTAYYMAPEQIPGRSGHFSHRYLGIWRGSLRTPLRGPPTCSKPDPRHLVGLQRD